MKKERYLKDLEDRICLFYNNAISISIRKRLHGEMRRVLVRNGHVECRVSTAALRASRMAAYNLPGGKQTK